MTLSKFRKALGKPGNVFRRIINHDVNVDGRPNKAVETHRQPTGERKFNLTGDEAFQ